MYTITVRELTLTERLDFEAEYGFVVDHDGIVDAPCGCPACNNGVQPGHFACNTSPAEMLRAEADGAAIRVYADGWGWVVL